MNSWPFVIAAYSLVLGATAILVLASLSAMRKAERAVEELKRK